MVRKHRAAQVGLAAALAVFASCMTLLARNAVVERKVLAAQPGTPAPDLTLRRGDGAGGKPVRLSDLRGAPVVLYFCSTRCPVSNDYDGRIRDLYQRFGADGRVRFVAIHSGAGAAADPAEVDAHAAVARLPFAHLLDPDRKAAERFGVTLTPTFLLLDDAGVVRYRGSLDDNRVREHATTPYLARALRSLLADEPVVQAATEVRGCAVR